MIDFVHHIWVDRTQFSPSSSRFLSAFYQHIKLLMWLGSLFCSSRMPWIFSHLILFHNTLWCLILLSILHFLGNCIKIWGIFRKSFNIRYSQTLIRVNIQRNFLAIANQTHYLAVVSKYLLILWIIFFVILRSILFQNKILLLLRSKNVIWLLYKSSIISIIWIFHLNLTTVDLIQEFLIMGIHFLFQLLPKPKYLLVCSFFFIFCFWSLFLNLLDLLLIMIALMSYLSSHFLHLFRYLLKLSSFTPTFFTLSPEKLFRNSSIKSFIHLSLVWYRWLNLIDIVHISSIISLQIILFLSLPLS